MNIPKIIIRIPPIIFSPKKIIPVKMIRLIIRIKNSITIKSAKS